MTRTVVPDGRHYAELAPDDSGITVVIYRMGGRVDGRTGARMDRVVHRDTLPPITLSKAADAILDVLRRL